MCVCMCVCVCGVCVCVCVVSWSNKLTCSTVRSILARSSSLTCPSSTLGLRCIMNERVRD